MYEVVKIILPAEIAFLPKSACMQNNTSYTVQTAWGLGEIIPVKSRLVLVGFARFLLLWARISMRDEIMKSGKMMIEGNSGIVSLGTVNDHS